MKHSLQVCILTIVCFVAHFGEQARAQTNDASTSSPAEITAILDQQKPQADKRAALEAASNRTIPSKGSASDIYAAYLERFRAKQQLGQLQEAITDLEAALAATRQKVSQGDYLALRHHHAISHWTLGEPKKSFDLFVTFARYVDAPGSKGWLFSAYGTMVQLLITLGDLAQAETYLRRAEAQLTHASSWDAWPRKQQIWTAHVEQARAALSVVRGELRQAEASYLKSEQLLRAAANNPAALDSGTSKDSLDIYADNMVRRRSQVKARQGRPIEAEADLRRALLNRLRQSGKYHPVSAHFITQLASIVVDQGRLQEGEQLARTANEVRAGIGLSQSSQDFVGGLNQIANILSLQGRWQEAAAAYAEIDDIIKSWEPRRRGNFQLNYNRSQAFYGLGRVEEGLKIARALLARSEGRGAVAQLDTAVSRGAVATGLSLAGRHDDALAEFRKSAPMLHGYDTDLDDIAESTSLRSTRFTEIFEAYLALLAKPASAGLDAAKEGFPIAEAARQGSVQKAVAASSARMVVRDPNLAVAARSEQDLQQQVNSRMGLLNHMLSLPPEERSDKSARELATQIDKLRADRAKIRKDLERKFPRYAELTDPKPPQLEEIRALLKPHEAYISFYFGRYDSYAWAFGKEGNVLFAPLGISSSELRAAVTKLRASLDAPLYDIEQIPAFDLQLAHELFARLLGPLQSVWQPAKSLIVVTNGALGYLPLAMLPTKAQALNSSDKTLFAGYRGVSWLARTHAVSSLPSAASLRALRMSPDGSAAREKLIGFGDPYFSSEQAVEAEGAVVTASLEQGGSVTRGGKIKRRALRGAGAVSAASLAQLSRLADTADELRAIAQAVQAEPSRALHLGRRANEETVKTTDLTRFRIIAFSTHGLVPGELDGLSQPALALSAPSVANVDGDGLLTMEEIMALKLDADWVVLSACNTAVGAGAGAEAVSGLGRAFFYAGSRALLVTNWSVESVSASKLVAEVFRVQSKDPQVDRAEALRQAMMHLLDSDADAQGASPFSYSHPLFWAPYSLVGAG